MGGSGFAIHFYCFEILAGCSVWCDSKVMLCEIKKHLDYRNHSRNDSKEQDKSGKTKSPAECEAFLRL